MIHPGYPFRSLRHRLPDALLALVTVEGVRVDALRDSCGCVSKRLRYVCGSETESGHLRSEGVPRVVRR
jgi:hypothetical protein